MTRSGWIVGAGAVVLVLLIGWLGISRSARGTPLPVTVEHEKAGRDYDMQVRLINAPAAGEQAELVVMLTENGAPIRLEGEDFSGIIHMTLASADVADHQHEYVYEENPRGEYTVTPPVWAAGPYRLWVEINNATTSDHHREQADWLGYVDFTVAPAAAPVAVPPVRQPGYRVELEHGDLRAGVPATIRARVETDAGELVKLLPVDSFYSIVGENAGWQLLAHVDQVLEEAAVSESTITFPEPGRYSWWTEHYIEGETQIVRDRFIFDVR